MRLVCAASGVVRPIPIPTPTSGPASARWAGAGPSDDVQVLLPVRSDEKVFADSAGSRGADVLAWPCQDGDHGELESVPYDRHRNERRGEWRWPF